MYHKSCDMSAFRFACLKNKYRSSGSNKQMQNTKKATNEHNHQRSWWLSLCGHSPFFLANVYYGLPAAWRLLLAARKRAIKLNSILIYSLSSSSFSWFLTYSAIRLSFFPTYPHSTLCTKIPDSGIYISPRRIAHTALRTLSNSGILHAGATEPAVGG